MKTTAYGPGDCESWQSCIGHPSDPRTPDPDDSPFNEYLAAADELKALAVELEQAAEHQQMERCEHICRTIRKYLP